MTPQMLIVYRDERGIHAYDTAYDDAAARHVVKRCTDRYPDAHRVIACPAGKVSPDALAPHR